MSLSTALLDDQAPKPALHPESGLTLATIERRRPRDRAKALAAALRPVALVVAIVAIIVMVALWWCGVPLPAWLLVLVVGAVVGYEWGRGL